MARPNKQEKSLRKEQQRQKKTTYNQISKEIKLIKRKSRKDKTNFDQDITNNKSQQSDSSELNMDTSNEYQSGFTGNYTSEYTVQSNSQQSRNSSPMSNNKSIFSKLQQQDQIQEEIELKKNENENGELIQQQQQQKLSQVNQQQQQQQQQQQYQQQTFQAQQLKQFNQAEQQNQYLNNNIINNNDINNNVQKTNNIQSMNMFSQDVVNSSFQEFQQPIFNPCTYRNQNSQQLLIFKSEECLDIAKTKHFQQPPSLKDPLNINNTKNKILYQRMITFHKLQAIKGKQRKIETDYKFGNKPRKESCSSYSQNLDQISTISINSPLFSLQNGQNEKDIYQKIQKANNQDNDSYDIYTTYTQSQSPVQFVQKQQELADISALQLNELSQKEQQTQVYGQINEEIKNKLNNQELKQFENLQKKCIRKRGRPKKVLNQEELKKMQLKKGAFKIKNTDDIIFYKVKMFLLFK
ncbi:hypothetical protein PPERSA_10097 [Pseudocohnilembus persalinus]|uniref:Uncharacterized protein n=1 Tax=Pseudocohnilembus persalinus TaxID=266149 RepID=A0A0V0QKB1_PSEPJ|nr:hypothetical protein PPERSA_10097 [Pseudocohnilembus persalinus]|eukprot:KRX02480.1 hypothetical protein PPERSA_10097 [Pseudocohnilembus persalinus]